MHDKCHIDIETYSEINLKKVGIYRYAEHPSTEIYVTCYCFDDGPVHCWIPREDLPRKLLRDLRKRIEERYENPGEIIVSPSCPKDLKSHAVSGGQMRAHNSAFERILLNAEAGRRIDFPPTNVSQWVCTAAKAAAHSLPRHLEGAAEQLETERKDALGKMDMMALCKPRTGKIKRYTVDNAPEKYLTTYTYCVDDVYAERGVDMELPDLSPREQRLFELDQKINDRGVAVDTEGVANVQVLIDEYKTFLEGKCREWTGLNPTQTAKLADWIRDNGYDIENLQAPTIKEALKDPDCPKKVKRVLRLRSVHSMKAVSKYDAIERSITLDDRLHGMFLYHGASTGRWSSLIVQLQNLFRPIIDDPDTAIEAFEAQDLEWIKALYDKDPMKVFASCVRGMLIAAEGNDLIAMDYAAIEARVVAWLAGQEDILEVFRDHGKVYEYTAAQIYKTPRSLELLKAMKKEFPERRFVGKIAVLALGYQGGKKAFAKMAKNYGVEIPEEQAEDIKKDWRSANDKIVRLWYEMEERAVAAVKEPGKVFALRNKKIMFKVEGKFLYMRLPSGRRLAYFKPRVDADDKLTYMGIDTYSRRWLRCSTYGGKLTENAVQAIARDLLAISMLKLDKKNYPIIGTVHDEVVLEVAKDFGSLDEVNEIMCDLPEWAEGLPVKAEGFRARRYRK